MINIRSEFVSRQEVDFFLVVLYHKDGLENPQPIIVMFCEGILYHLSEITHYCL